MTCFHKARKNYSQVTMDKNKKGAVYLVGAGPGDPDLITVKGKRLLRYCDVVVYDNLIPLELLIFLRPETEKYYVGKTSGRHTLPQDEINELLVRLALEGKQVVRLKGGDPFVFGRGGEEAAFLNEHSIKFEIVPGVTSGVAGPAYGGIPVTERNKASFVMFLTGHKADEKVLPSISWDWVAQAKNGTLVIYMGVKEIEKIAGKLMASGMAPDLPVAVIERGTFPTQRKLVSTLGRIAKDIEKQEIHPPALFVFGEVVNLQEQLNWFEDRPLYGLRVMVTRPAAQAHYFYKRLRELGAEPLPYPTIATEEVIDDEKWQFYRKIDSNNAWLVFTSENGVRYFLRQHAQYVGDVRRLSNFKIAAVGSATARELEKYSLKADFVPSEATVNALTEEMLTELNLDRAYIVRVQGTLSNDVLEKFFIEKRIKVLPLTVYQTVYAEWLDELKEKLITYPPDVVIFTSGSTVKGLCQILSGDVECKKLMERVKVVSIGPSTSKVIRSYNMEIAIEAKEHTVDGIIDAMLEYYKKNPFVRQK